jgi:hypothetical protein
MDSEQVSSIINGEIAAIEKQIKALYDQELQVQKAITELLIIRNCYIIALNVGKPEEQLEFPFVKDVVQEALVVAEAN